MLIATLLFASSAVLNTAKADSARLRGDTVFVEPIGVRFTLPSLWLGRAGQPRLSGADRERLLCQYSESSPIADRIVLDRTPLLALSDQARGHRQAYQAALHAVIPDAAVVAHVGGAPFSGGCGAPQIRFYLVDSAAQKADAGAVAQAAIERSFAGVTRTQIDSAGWRIIRLGWRVTEFDYIFPGALELWSRAVGDRIVIVAVMDAWTAAGDVRNLMSSIGFPNAPALNGREHR